MIAALELSSDPAVRLPGQVREVFLVHGATHAEQQLAAATRRCVVVASGTDHADAPMLETADDRLHVDGVARQAIERLNDQRIEACGERVFKQGCAARTMDD